MAKYFFTVFWRDRDGHWHNCGQATTWRKAAIKAATLAQGADGGRFLGLSGLSRPLSPRFAIHYDNVGIAAGDFGKTDDFTGFLPVTEYPAAFDRHWDLLTGRPIKG